MKAEDLITEDEIIAAFANANFGVGSTRRELINKGILKCKEGYHNGHTMQCILIELGLSGASLKLTVMGCKYIALISK